MFCSHCGQELKDTARFCTECGAPVTAAPGVSPAQPQTVQPQRQPQTVQPQNIQPQTARPQGAPPVRTQNMQPQSAPPKKKKKTGLIVAGIIAALLVMALAVFAIVKIFGGDASRETDAPDGVVSASWEELYDLGIRYMQEQNYEEAIAAFTESIEIDSRQAVTYVGRGQCYVLSGETEENLSAAQADFETALELDDTIVDAWLGLADVHSARDDDDAAREVLERAQDRLGDLPQITERIGRLESASSGARVQSVDYKIELQDLSYYDASGEPQIILTYDLIKIIGSNPAFEKINKQIYNNYEQFFGVNGREGFRDYLDGMYYPYFDTGMLNMGYNDNGIFSFAIEQEWYMGGVYNLDYNGETYDLNTGEKLGIPELLGLSETETGIQLLTIMENYIWNEWYEPSDEAVATVRGYEVEDYEFYVNGGEIILLFDTYVLGSGASGPAVVSTGLMVNR